MVGMTKCAQVVLPEIGSIRHQTPKTMIIMSANQKVGRACPKTAISRAKRSISELGRMAATVPSGIETISANRIARTPNVMVVPIRPEIMSTTGCL